MNNSWVQATCLLFITQRWRETGPLSVALMECNGKFNELWWEYCFRWEEEQGRIISAVTTLAPSYSISQSVHGEILSSFFNCRFCTPSFPSYPVSHPSTCIIHRKSQGPPYHETYKNGPADWKLAHLKQLAGTVDWWRLPLHQGICDIRDVVGDTGVPLS